MQKSFSMKKLTSRRKRRTPFSLGVGTPAQGCDGVFVGSGIFKSANAEERARAMVNACSHYNNAKILARVSSKLGKVRKTGGAF